MLELRGVHYSRPGGWLLDVDSFRLAPRRLIRITGANGAGKTTLLRLLAYHLRPQAGSIVYRGADVGSDRGARRLLRREVVLVHQSPFLFDRTVLDNVLYGLRLRRVPRGEARRRAADALDRLGVVALAKRPARELSGGEGQRVALARALVLRPRVLLLDEPTAAVDAENAVRVRDLIATRDWSPDASVVVTTHTGSRIGITPDESFSIRGGRLRQWVEGPPDDTAAELITASKKAEET